MRADRLENRASCLENDKSVFNRREPALAVLTVRRIWRFFIASALCHRPRWPTTNMIMLSAVATIHPPFQGVSGLGVSRRPCWSQTRISTDGYPHQYSSSGRSTYSSEKALAPSRTVGRAIIVRQTPPHLDCRFLPACPEGRAGTVVVTAGRARRTTRYGTMRPCVWTDCQSESVPDQFRKGY